MTKAEVEEIVRIRQVLEPIAVKESVARMTPVIRARGRKRSSPKWRPPNSGTSRCRESAFHRKNDEAVAVPTAGFADQESEDTQVRFRQRNPAESPMLKETATRDHHEMIEAIEAGDADRLIETTLWHLRSRSETESVEGGEMTSGPIAFIGLG